MDVNFEEGGEWFQSDLTCHQGRGKIDAYLVKGGKESLECIACTTSYYHAVC